MAKLKYATQNHSDPNQNGEAKWAQGILPRDDSLVSKIRRTYREDLQRLVDLLVMEYMRKKNHSIRTMPQEQQIQTLLGYWQSSLSRERITYKLKQRQLKGHELAEKERWLLGFLDGSDEQSLF